MQLFNSISSQLLSELITSLSVDSIHSEECQIRSLGKIKENYEEVSSVCYQSSKDFRLTLVLIISIFLGR